MIKITRIKKNLTKFTFPRLSGTEFELKAFNKLKQEIEDLNLEFEVQKFTFSTFYSRIYPKISFFSVSLMLFLFYLTIFVTMSLILGIILFSIVIISVLLTRKPEKIQFISKLNSQNLLVKIKSISDDIKNKDRIVLFTSHLDSKGQRFRIKTRIRIIKLWFYTSIILTVIIILKILILGFELMFYVIGLFPVILNMFASILILLNTTNNSSEGAVDNASGIVCNLEMLHYYNIPENRLTNYNMWFLFTGAEECGTMGIRHFYNNLENFDPDKSIAFDFESITNYIILFPGGKEIDHAKDINYLLLNNNRNLAIKNHSTNRIFGTHSDGGFLGDKGFQGYGIGGAGAHAYMHTSNDTIDKVNPPILKRLCLVLTDALKKHDSNFFK
ncbi:MAG: M28 family peptidase [Promethearchaeota archaeon]|nr:MAG: M28 family peptidase [Candidatus Lokiarchaeota archaeon]